MYLQEFHSNQQKIAVTPDIYISEIQNAKLLVDKNYKVYLLPENFAFKRQNELGQNESYSTPDTLTNNEFVELKKTKKKISERFGDAITQSNNVLIRIKDDISVYNAKKRLQEKIKNIPREKGFNVKDGNIFLYFEKSARFISAEIKNGKIKILPTLPKLADYSVVPPAETNIPQSTKKSSPLPKIQKMTVSEYNNKEVDAFVTDKSGFVDPEKIAAIDLYGFEKAKEMWKDGEPDWNTRMMLQDKSISDYLNWKHPNNQNYKVDNITYGFAYQGKIYLNPDIMTSEVAVHEYTHLWDAYTQRTNPELWQKGKEIFKNTQFWNEVKNDPNYEDIADNDDLLLSEVHSQICGKMAEEILNRIAEKDGELTKDTVIDWDKEVWEYVANSIDVANFNKETFVYEDVKEFLVKPIKDLMNGVEITKVINLNTEKGLQTKTKQLNKDEFSSIKFSDAFISKNNGILPVIKSGNGYLVGCKKSDIDDFQSPNKFTVNDDILLLIPLEKSALSSIYSKYVINKAKEDFIKSMNDPDFVPESRKLGISDDQKRLYKMVEDNVFKGIELTGNETEVFNAYVKDIIQVNRNAKNQQQLNNYSIITKQIDTDEIDFER